MLFSFPFYPQIPLRLRVAASAFGRRSRPKADEGGGARQGGLYNLLDFNKSPLGDLGVSFRKSTFSTAPTSHL